MFWKKNQTKGMDSLKIEFDADRRSYFRVEPLPDKPVAFKTDRAVYKVTDISAGGLSLMGEGFAVGMEVAGAVILPESGGSIPVVLAILSVPAPGRARGEFKRLTEKNREDIHYYVLEAQKETLRRKQEAAAKARRNNLSQAN